MAHVVTASELPLVVRFLSQQLPASLKLHGETLALLHGIDATSHGPALGDDLVMNTAGIATLHAADAAGAVISMKCLQPSPAATTPVPMLGLRGQDTCSCPSLQQT